MTKKKKKLGDLNKNLKGDNPGLLKFPPKGDQDPGEKSNHPPQKDGFSAIKRLLKNQTLHIKCLLIGAAKN